ncbi:class I SAM-dependent methyltransferase [Bacteroidota bacterium]
MRYSERLRRLLEGVMLNVEDLLILESFQIKYFPERIPQKEFSAVLRKYPFIHHFLVLKCPSVKEFIDTVLRENEEITDPDIVDSNCDELIWEIADLIVYNKYPEIYNDKTTFSWKMNEIISVQSLEGKVVADVGAGPGTLAILLAKYAKTVYAVEPITSFRDFIRGKAKKEECCNIYTIDGFLDSIPLPDNSFDILFTSNAIGWNLEKELLEIERVVKPGGQAIHLARSIEKETDNPFHDTLISSDWNYTCIKYEDEAGLRLKYLKTM